MKLPSKLKHLLIRRTNVSASSSCTWIVGSVVRAQFAAPWIHCAESSGVGMAERTPSRISGRSLLSRHILGLHSYHFTIISKDDQLKYINLHGQQGRLRLHLARPLGRAMFAYSDPTGTGFLAQVGALEAYRNKVRTLDERFDALPNSGFTLREAFDEL